MNDIKRMALFDKLYKQIPTIACKGLCAEACGPIAATEFEVKRLEMAANHPLTVDAELTCSMLKEHRCTVYEHRPMVCRLFGLVKQMPCPHGCTPERRLTDPEANRFMSKALDLGGNYRVSQTPEGENYVP